MADDGLNKFLAQFNTNKGLALKASENIFNSTLNEMYKKIVERTPIGKPELWKWPAHIGYVPGTLRESWSLSFDNIQRNELGQFASTAQILGNNGLSFKSTSSSNQEAVISNPQPYAQRVETGWSTQAPQGMMRVTVAEFSSIIDQNTIKYGIK